MLQVKEPLVILQLAVGFMLGVACIAIAVNTGHEHCEAGAATTTAAAAATGKSQINPRHHHPAYVLCGDCCRVLLSQVLTRGTPPIKRGNRRDQELGGFVCSPDICMWFFISQQFDQMFSIFSKT
jgi:hypothetical protein